MGLAVIKGPAYVIQVIMDLTVISSVTPSPVIIKEVAMLKENATATSGGEVTTAQHLGTRSSHWNALVGQTVYAQAMAIVVSVGGTQDVVMALMGIGVRAEQAFVVAIANQAFLVLPAMPVQAATCRILLLTTPTLWGVPTRAIGARAVIV
jgi:hypothetical protein